MCQCLYFVLVKQTKTEYQAGSGKSRSSLGATAQSAPQTRACQLLRCQYLYLCTSESKRGVVKICEHTERQAPAALSASVFVLKCWYSKYTEYRTTSSSQKTWRPLRRCASVFVLLYFTGKASKVSGKDKHRTTSSSQKTSRSLRRCVCRVISTRAATPTATTEMWPK
jgi:hypothetical protein